MRAPEAQPKAAEYVIPSHKKLIAVLTRGDGKLILSHGKIVIRQFPLGREPEAVD